MKEKYKRTIFVILFVILITVGVYYFTGTPSSPQPSTLSLSDFGKLGGTPTNEHVVWSFWHDSKWPLLVQICVKSWHLHNPGYVINVLSLDTYQQFIDTKTLPRIFNKLSRQHQADVIRLALLKKYGGYWLDSTVLLTQPLANVWEPMNYDVGGFNGSHLQTNPNKPVLENWFIAAPKGSPLIAAWYDEFVGSFDRFDGDGISFNANRVAYVHDLETRRGIDIQNVFNTSYFSMHCAFLAITQHTRYNIFYQDAGFGFARKKGPLSYIKKGFGSYIPFYRAKEYVNDMLTTRLYSDLPIIKYPAHERKSFTNSAWQSLRPDSTIGDVVFARL